MIEVRVPATVANLGPGFDCLGLALSLYNTIEVYEEKENGAGPRVQVCGEGEGELPDGDENLTWAVFQSVFRRVAGEPPPSLRLRTTNRIPLARGLGSSASAIVGGILAANRLAGDPLSAEQVLELAAEKEGHPDNVAAALGGGVTICWESEDDGQGAARPSGTGRYRSLSLPPPPGITVAVAIPSFSLSTRKARAALPATVPLPDASFNAARTALLVAAVLQGRNDLLAEATRDRLHQPYRRSLVPGLEEALAAGRRAGALGVGLSGAGPSVFALVGAGTDARDVAAWMARAFAQRGVQCRTWCGDIAARGAEVKKRP